MIVECLRVNGDASADIRNSGAAFDGAGADRRWEKATFGEIQTTTATDRSNAASIDYVLKSSIGWQAGWLGGWRHCFAHGVLWLLSSWLANGGYGG